MILSHWLLIQNSSVDCLVWTCNIHEMLVYVDMQWNWYPYVLRYDQGVDAQGTEARVGSSSAPQTPVASEGRVYHRDGIPASPSEGNVRVTQETSFEGSPRGTPPTSPRSLNEASSVREQTPLGQSSKKPPPVPPRKKSGTSPRTEHTRENPSGATPASAGRSTYGDSPQTRDHSTLHTTPRRTPPTSPRRVTKTFQLTESTLLNLSNEIPHENIESLGLKLGFKHVEIGRFKDTNRQGSSVTCDGTNAMLHKWFQQTGKKEAHIILGKALIGAGLLQLKEEYCEMWFETSQEVERTFDMKWK